MKSPLVAKILLIVVFFSAETNLFGQEKTKKQMVAEKNKNRKPMVIKPMVDEHDTKQHSNKNHYQPQVKNNLR